MYGILYCLVLFTNNPIRREFRCPLYRVFALRHNQDTHTLTTYKQNEEYSIVTWNMKHLSNVWCLITQFQHIQQGEGPHGKCGLQYMRKGPCLFAEMHPPMLHVTSQITAQHAANQLMKCQLLPRWKSNTLIGQLLQHSMDSYIMTIWYVGQACLFSFQPT